MRLKTKILLIALLPIVLLGGTAIPVTALQTEKAMKEQIGYGLAANALALKDAIDMDASGDYRVDEQGNLYKGEVPVKNCQGLIDDVYAKTGIAMTVFYDDTRAVTAIRDTDGSYAVGTKASPEIVAGVLKSGETMLASNVDVNGEPYYAYYLPLYNSSKSSGPVGMVFAGSSQAVVEGKVDRITLSIAAINVFLIVVFAGISLLIATRIANALQRTSASAEAIAGGNLAVTISPKDQERQDEVGQISRSIKSLISGLADILHGVRNQSEILMKESSVLSTTAQTTTDTMEQVNQAVLDIAHGANSQAEETQRATENVVLMGDMVADTGREVGKLHENAEKMRVYSEQAAATLEELGENSVKSQQSMEEIYLQTLHTNESALRIRTAVNLITDIARQTNLLSLNASIEAARAGEAGKGFSVVASQIQKLAEQSNASAKQIEEIIELLIRDSETAVRTMENVREIVNCQNEEVSNTRAVFDRVMDGIAVSILSAGEIAVKTDRMNEARINVVDVVQNLTAIAEENAASTEQTSASVTEVSNIALRVTDSAQQLHAIAKALEGSLSVFRF